VSRALAPVDDLLRGQWATRVQRRGPALAILLLLAYVIAFGMAYGAVMGAYGGIAGDRLWQVLYSAIKVPFLLLVSFAISLPLFFVLNTLFGLREDFGQAMQALIATQAGVAIILASLAPYTAVWYLSTTDYNRAILFNGAMFAAASFSAQWLLRDFYGPLIRRQPRHRWMLWAWITAYAFVGIQMAWMLRPFVGVPALPVQFFREEKFDNAYLIVGRKILEALPW